MRQEGGRPITSVLLAGTLRPPPLYEGLGMPPLALPVALGDGTICTAFEAWLRALDAVGAGEDVRVVVNAPEDVEALARGTGAAGSDRLRTITEPAAWRGAAGIVRDVTRDLPADALVIIGEASALPPADLTALVRAVRPPCVGAVGVAGAAEPAGVYAFTLAAIEHVPAVGYHDLKEQLLPALTAHDLPVVAAPTAGPARRLRDRRGYLAAIRAIVRGAVVADTARVDPSAVLDGSVLVGPCVRLEAGCVVHDSVLLAGAVVGRDAVVTRSVIGPGHVVPAGRRVVREMRRGTGAWPAPPVPSVST